MRAVARLYDRGMRRPQLTYANVMSTIAVFLALGGTSYAVARNSIGNRELKRNAVTSSKVKDRSLATSDLSPSARIGRARAARLAGPARPAGLRRRAARRGGWTPLSFGVGWAQLRRAATAA